MPLLLITLPAGVILSVLLLKERETFHPWTFKESQWAVLSLGLMSGALFCWGPSPLGTLSFSILEKELKV